MIADVTGLSRARAGMQMNRAPENAPLPEGFREFLQPLHRRFTSLQQEFIEKRQQVLQAAHAGRKPQHRLPSEATKTNWRIALPDFVQDQRNQMTGPADDAELVVKMLNSGAPGVMLDLEDSMANFWDHLELGIKNIHAALRNELTYFDKKRNKEVGINESKTVIFTRARGLHLSQRLPGLDALAGAQGPDQQRKAEFSGPDALPTDLASASLYDVCRMAFGVEPAKLKHPLCYYIP